MEFAIQINVDQSPLDALESAVEQPEIIQLSLADQECFAQALLSPEEPIPALEKAFHTRSKLLRTE